MFVLPFLILSNDANPESDFTILILHQKNHLTTNFFVISPTLTKYIPAGNPLTSTC